MSKRNVLSYEAAENFRILYNAGFNAGCGVAHTTPEGKKIYCPFRLIECGNASERLTGRNDLYNAGCKPVIVAMYEYCRKQGYYDRMRRIKI